MPHRNRTLLLVVSLVWILVIVATLVNAAVRTGAVSGEDPGQGGHPRSTAMLPKAPAPGAAKPAPTIDTTPPA